MADDNLGRGLAVDLLLLIDQASDQDGLAGLVGTVYGDRLSGFSRGLGESLAAAALLAGVRPDSSLMRVICEAGSDVAGPFVQETLRLLTGAASVALELGRELAARSDHDLGEIAHALEEGHADG